MDLQVAVDKLNNMSMKEIIHEALALPIPHMPCRSDECLIANLIRWWGVENPEVGAMFMYTLDPEGKANEAAIETPRHVAQIIQAFDRGELQCLM